MDKKSMLSFYVRVWRTGLICAFSLFFVGCAIQVKNDQAIRGFCFDEKKERDQGEENFKVLEEKYGQEWELNHGDKHAPPMLGLSLSGGGMRSAAFSIGVLKGLHDNGTLPEIDLMSSVSGGGYALSWYYLQKYNSGVSDDVLFGDNDRFQTYLVENGRIITHSNNFFIQFPEYLVKLGVNVIATPCHWLANGLFDWNLNLASYRLFYQNAIEREFHLTPSTDSHDPLNEKSFLGWTIGVDKPIEFEEMRTFLKKNKLPNFIINTTAEITDDMGHHGADLGNIVFEFTPYAFGSDAFGYQNTDYPVDIHTAVAISGAAADSSILPAKNGMLISALNVDLGYNIPNYNITDQAKIARHNLLPFPIYYAKRNNKDILGTSIYLTDGGHAENLGAFSLIKRLCRNIIIVDAEYDPHYQFEAYHKLKNSLRKELGVDFRISEIDTGLAIDTIEFAGNEDLREYILPDSLRQKINFSSDAIVTYNPTNGFWLLTDQQTKKTIIAKQESEKLVLYKQYDGATPVMHGEIAWFPLKEGEKHERISLNVTYIKLSLDVENIEKYPPSVSDYYREHKPNRLKELIHFQNTRFPHEETSDISYSEKQFRAYRDLGRYIVCTYFGCSCAD